MCYKKESNTTFSPSTLTATSFGSTTSQLRVIFLRHLYKKYSLPPIRNLCHKSAFTDFVSGSFRIPLSFQIISSSMVSPLTLHNLVLTSSQQLLVFLLIAPKFDPTILIIMDHMCELNYSICLNIKTRSNSFYHVIHTLLYYITLYSTLPCVCCGLLTKRYQYSYNTNLYTCSNSTISR